MINSQLHASGHRAHENARYLLRKWTVASRRVPTGSSRLCNVKNCTRSWHFIVPSLVLGLVGRLNGFDFATLVLTSDDLWYEGIVQKPAAFDAIAGGWAGYLA